MSKVVSHACGISKDDYWALMDDLGYIPVPAEWEV